MRWGGLLALAMAAASCGGGRQPAPRAGDSMGRVPSLQGRRVMVLPAQDVVDVPGAADAEIAFALEERSGERVRWVLPREMREMLRRSPGLPMRIDGLPVDMFLRGEVNRVGDPLYGHLRRLAAMTEADLALVPIQVRYRAGDDATPSAVEIAAALIDARTGRVHWFGIVEGEPGARGDPRTLASAADALARAVVG